MTTKVSGAANLTIHVGMRRIIGSSHPNCFNTCPFREVAIHNSFQCGAKSGVSRKLYERANAYCEIISLVRDEKRSITFTFVPDPWSACRRKISLSTIACTSGSSCWTELLEKKDAKFPRRIRCSSWLRVENVALFDANILAGNSHFIVRFEDPGYTSSMYSGSFMWIS